MAFETKSVTINTKKVLGVGEFAISTKISLDAEKPLKKILNIKATADVGSTEQIDSDFNLLGKTQINLLYLTENNTLESVVGFADYSTLVKAYGESLHAKLEIKEVSVESSSATEVGLSILHNAIVEGIEKVQISPVTELPEGYVTQDKTVNLNQICASNADKFVVAENLDMPNAVKILNTDAHAKVKNVVAGIDCVSIEGEIDVRVLYATEDSTNTITKTLDFKQEISCMGTVPANLSYAYINVSSINSTLEVGEKTTLVLAIGFNAIVDSYENKEFSVVTDLYSLNKLLDTTTECVYAPNFVAGKYINDTAVCNVNVDSYNVDEVVAVICPNVKISQATTFAGNIITEGVVDLTLIYKDNQVEETNSVVLSCPYVSKVDDAVAGGLQDVFVSCNLSSVKIRSGKEVEIVLDLAIASSNSKDEYFEYVKPVTETADREQNSSAVTIYVTKEGESLFNVARALNVLPETINSQNEVVDGKFAGGQRIFVYSPLNVEF